MLKLKNNITIKHGRITQTVSNTVLDVFSAITGGEAYGQNIFLRGGGRTFSTPSTLESINANVTNGLLTAS
ncbi:MAG: hypothetical protein FWE22_00135 [Firmicutes bacterium]|nr:hypothetical protein [Bacillota bacterium]